MITIGFSITDPLSGLAVIASEPGAGKSALALTTAIRLAKEGHGVALFSLEMNSDEQMARLFSVLSGIPVSTIRARDLKKEELAKVQAVLEDDYKKWSEELIIEEGVFSLSKIQTTLSSLKKDGKVDVAIIDRFELVRERPFLGSREDELCYISRELKESSLSLGIPIILLATVKPDRRRKRLSTDCLKATLEADADFIAFLERNGTAASLEVVKNRYGKPKGASLVFDAEHVTFTERRVNEQGSLF